MTIIVKITINTALRPSKMGANRLVSQGITPVTSLDRAEARGMGVATMKMTGQETAASECLMSLKTIQALPSPSPLGSTISKTAIRQYRPPMVRVSFRKEAKPPVKDPP